MGFALKAGDRLGHYEILGLLGVGGMGEVYRATDTRLGRDVAVKVLPASLATDPDRLERFRREARAVAALNHPHIVTIHSVEEAPSTPSTGSGQAGSGHAQSSGFEHRTVHFLTMELVEGQSLDRSLSQDGLPLDRIVSIATALADALAAAHEKGIVHRDLKPANIMITSGGRVKVLDFGLAKEMRASDPGDDATLVSAGNTGVGVVMGTPAYMSPEQIAGRGWTFPVQPPDHPSARLKVWR